MNLVKQSEDKRPAEEKM
jgi:hypothetical protein